MMKVLHQVKYTRENPTNVGSLWKYLWERPENIWEYRPGSGDSVVRKLIWRPWMCVVALMLCHGCFGVCVQATLYPAYPTLFLLPCHVHSHCHTQGRKPMEMYSLHYPWNYTFHRAGWIMMSRYSLQQLSFSFLSFFVLFIERYFWVSFFLFYCVILSYLVLKGRCFGVTFS